MQRITRLFRGDPPIDHQSVHELMIFAADVDSVGRTGQTDHEDNVHYFAWLDEVTGGGGIDWGTNTDDDELGLILDTVKDIDIRAQDIILKPGNDDSSSWRKVEIHLETDDFKPRSLLITGIVTDAVAESSGGADSSFFEIDQDMSITSFFVSEAWPHAWTEFNINAPGGFDLSGTDDFDRNYAMALRGIGFDISFESGNASFEVSPDVGVKNFIPAEGTFSINKRNSDNSIGALYFSCFENSSVRKISMPVDRIGFFGVTPVVRQSTPTTLSDVITGLQALGLFS